MILGAAAYHGYRGVLYGSRQYCPELPAVVESFTLLGVSVEHDVPASFCAVAYPCREYDRTVNPVMVGLFVPHNQKKFRSVCGYVEHTEKHGAVGRYGTCLLKCALNSS